MPSIDHLLILLVFDGIDASDRSYSSRVFIVELLDKIFASLKVVKWFP